MFSIDDTADLKEYFRKNPDKCVYVKKSIRNAWMLNHERTINNGIVRDISFENVGGGIYLARLCVTKTGA